MVTTVALWIEVRGTEDTGSLGADESPDEEALIKEVPVAFRRRGVESKIILPGKARAPEPDAELIKVVRDAQRWFDQIVKGRVTTVKEIAEAEGLDAGDVSRFLPLAFLAPDIVEKIIDGEQPIDLNAEKLKRLPLLPKAWIEQRDVMNFGRQK